jgi:hypothetical protein
MWHDNDGERPRGAGGRGNHGHLSADQIGRQFRHSIFSPSGPAELDRHVALAIIILLDKFVPDSLQQIVTDLMNAGLSNDQSMVTANC